MMNGLLLLRELNFTKSVARRAAAREWGLPLETDTDIAMEMHHCKELRNV